MPVRFQRPPITDDRIDRSAGLLMRPAAREPLPVVLLHAAQARVHSRCFSASTSDPRCKAMEQPPGRRVAQRQRSARHDQQCAVRLGGCGGRCARLRGGTPWCVAQRAKTAPGRHGLAGRALRRARQCLVPDVHRRLRHRRGRWLRRRRARAAAALHAAAFSAASRVTMRSSRRASSCHSSSASTQPPPLAATRSASAPIGGTSAGLPAAQASESVKLNVSGPADG